MCDDTKLIEEIKSGSRKSFESLVKKYKTMVFNTAYSVVGNMDDADDVAQEVFLTVYRSINSFKYNSLFSTWLYRITLNKSISKLKSRKQFIPLDENFQETEIQQLIDTKSDLESQQRRILVQKLINSLPEKYRIIISLKEFDGLSYNEIAEVMKISVNKVKVWLFRARKMLKEKLLSGGKQNEL